MDDSTLHLFFDGVGLAEPLARFVALAIAGRKKETEGMFTNDLHYEVFKHLKRRPDEVILAPSYVALIYRYRFRNREAKSVYFVGINSDGKLFINRVRWEPLALSDLGGCMGVKVSLSSDDKFREVMMFDYDAEGERIKSIPVPGQRGSARYRVQGDLLLIVRPIESAHNEYFKLVKERLFWFIFRELRNVLIDRTSLLLASHGISTIRLQRRSGDELLLEAIPRRLCFIKRAIMVERLSGLIRDELYCDDIDEITISNINPVDEPRNFRYAVYSIAPTPRSGSVMEIVDKVISELNPRAERRTIYFGRHKIVVSAYPLRLVATVNLPASDPEVGREPRIFTFVAPALYVEPCEIEVSHPEHGTVKYDIVEPVEMSFANVEVHPDFVSRLSYYALKRL